MNQNQHIELRLLEEYNRELIDIFDSDRFKIKVREGKESSKQLLNSVQRKIDAFEKQTSRYKGLFPDAQDIRYYEASVYYFQGRLKIQSGLHCVLYPGMFSRTQSDELYVALRLFDKSLELTESSNTRQLKVLCYRLLDDKKNALKELDLILEHYADDEDVYLFARKDKDELEASSPTGIAGFLRSIWG